MLVRLLENRITQCLTMELSDRLGTRMNNTDTEQAGTGERNSASLFAGVTGYVPFSLIGESVETGVERAEGVGGVLRFAYADPPYIGQAKKHYSHDPNCAEVDHAELIARLNTYDGWALSLSSPTLKQILALCPDDVRVGAWVKPFCAFKVNVNPAYAWEPVIFRGGRKLGRDVDTVRDWCSEVITLKRGLSGAKPERVCHWLFEFLGMERGDVFDDIFPGSGAVTRAWASYCATPKLALQAL